MPLLLHVAEATPERPLMAPLCVNAQLALGF